MSPPATHVATTAHRAIGCTNGPGGYLPRFFSISFQRSFGDSALYRALSSACAIASRRSSSSNLASLIVSLPLMPPADGGSVMSTVGRFSSSFAYAYAMLPRLVEVGVTGLEPVNPKGSGFTARRNCRYATLPMLIPRSRPPIQCDLPRCEPSNCGPSKGRQGLCGDSVRDCSRPRPLQRRCRTRPERQREGP